MENLQTPEIEPTIPYDIVELPSKGIFYENNKKTLKVSYLTASDENILTSPNLSESGELMDTLLKAKILDKDINVKNLAECDKQSEFTHLEDLSILRTKEVGISPNQEGLFEFTLPKSGKNCKLRLLTPEDTVYFQKLEESYANMKIKPMATKKLEKCIVEDPMNLSLEIHKLPLKDAQEIRKFLNKVEPGLDLERKVKAPSGKEVSFTINFGLNFFRPFFGL